MRFSSSSLLGLRAFIYRIRYLLSLRNYATRCIFSCIWFFLDHDINILGSRSPNLFLGYEFAYLLPIFMVLLHEEYELSPELVMLTSFNLQGLLQLLDTSMQSLHAVMRHRTLVTALASWAACPSKRFPYSFSSFYLLNML